MSSADRRLALVVVLALGALVRLLPIVTASGPIGDGGLIVAMIDDIRDAGLRLPAATSYNQLDIPFVYPPLALWVAAAIGQVGDIATIDLVRWVPAFVSIGTLGVFAVLASRLLGGSPAVYASAVYALMPHAYDWLVAGGGLTRGVGLTFALGALATISTSPGRRVRPVVAGILLGLAGLAHPQAGVFGAISLVILAGTRSRQAVRDVAMAGAAAALVTLPWLLVVVVRGDFGALAGAGSRLEPWVGLVRLINLEFAGSPFMNVFVVAGAVGLVVSVARGEWRLPALLVATYVAGAGGGEFLAAVPWSLLGGVGAATIVGAVVDGGAGMRPPVRRAARIGIAAVVLFVAILGSVGSFADRSSKLQSLGAGRVDAMSWSAANLPDDVEFIVPTSEVWGDDEISEWLPAIAGRQSIGTVQGTEWLGAERFAQRVETHEAILDCSGSTAACYRAIDEEAVIFIPKGEIAGPFSAADCCPALRATLFENGYRIVYDGPGATIAQSGE